MGVLADKEYEQMIAETAGLADCIYTVAPNNERALSSDQLAKTARKYHPKVYVKSRLAQCLDEVKKTARKEDVIVIFGTLSFKMKYRG